MKEWCLLEREDEALDFTHVVINLGCAYGLWEVASGHPFARARARFGMMRRGIPSLFLFGFPKSVSW